MPIVLPILPEPSPGETGRYRVIAKHRALPGRADVYQQRMFADLENTRAEPGALQLHIHRDRFDPDVFVIYEVWKDLGALRKHFDMPYVRQFVTDSADYVDGNMEVQWLVMAMNMSPVTERMRHGIARGVTSGLDFEEGQHAHRDHWRGLDRSGIGEAVGGRGS